MNVSQKCQYALRAVFELAKRYGEKPTTIGQIAESEAIPARFLEAILAQLRQGGFVQSRRGVHGGYVLALPPREITVGQLIRYVDGPLGPVRCVAGSEEVACPLGPDCSFKDLWERAREAVAAVYDNTSFQDLIDQDVVRTGRAASFSI